MLFQRVIVNNVTYYPKLTCAFDSFSQILIVHGIDCPEVFSVIDVLADNFDFFKFIYKICTEESLRNEKNNNIIWMDIYTKRCELLLQLLNVDIENNRKTGNKNGKQNQGNTMKLDFKAKEGHFEFDCTVNVSHIAPTLLKEYPAVFQGLQDCPYGCIGIDKKFPQIKASESDLKNNFKNFLNVAYPRLSGCPTNFMPHLGKKSEDFCSGPRYYELLDTGKCKKYIKNTVYFVLINKR